jgi:LacI family transcriptional regulator
MHRVALIYDAKLPYDVKVMRGVARYLRERGRWNVFIEERALGDQRLPNLHAWQVSGIIADLDDPHVAEIARGLDMPVVGFGGGYGWRGLLPNVPYVKSDNAAVARLGAEHLLERGFRHLAFCGYRATKINGWSAERESAYASLVTKRGHLCSIYKEPSRTDRAWESFYHPVCRWLRSLPTPLGLMAANDKCARQVLEACRICKLRVPVDVAVIGVDNDEMICELSNPTLSSVIQGCDKIGFEAAALLDGMMAGRCRQRREVVVQPEGVVARRSTDILAIEDERVTSALELINERACEGWKVNDVAQAMGVSRSTLENHFKAALGRTVSDQLRHVRLELVRRLTVETELPLKQIAARSGFHSVQHMTSAFHNYSGETPAKYRRTGGDHLGRHGGRVL